MCGMRTNENCFCLLGWGNVEKWRKNSRSKERRNQEFYFDHVHFGDSLDIQVEMLGRKLDKQMSLKLQNENGTGDIHTRVIGL